MKPVRLVEHLLLGLVKVKSKAQQLLDALGVSGKEILQALQKVRGGQTVTDQNPDDKYRPGTVRARPRRAGSQGQDGPGNRPRPRDKAAGAGARPANQEQPVPGRPAGGGPQNGDCPRSGPSDPLGDVP